MSGADVEAELSARVGRFRVLSTRGSRAHRVPAAAVNELVGGIRVFYGGRGIWYDASRTREIRRPGVTVGVLHTGRHYDDELAEDGVIYHYPDTDSPGKDAAEVQATKNAGELGLPVYVVVQHGQLRDVYLSWVVDWDDVENTFLILFGPEAEGLTFEPPGTTTEPWIAFDEAPKRRSVTQRRARDPRFAFFVKKRYGNRCAACGFAAGKLVEGAHLITVAEGGSNHPGNGLPMCPTHHRAFDANLLAISPTSLEFVALGEPSLAELRVSEASIDGLPAHPHAEALAWRWAYAHNRPIDLPALTEPDLDLLER